jgi:hypothetical protein
MRFQFSLRGMMIAVAICAVISALCVHLTHEYQARPYTQSRPRGVLIMSEGAALQIWSKDGVLVAYPGWQAPKRGGVRCYPPQSSVPRS